MCGVWDRCMCGHVGDGVCVSVRDSVCGHVGVWGMVYVWACGGVGRMYVWGVGMVYVWVCRGWCMCGMCKCCVCVWVCGCVYYMFVHTCMHKVTVYMCLMCWIRMLHDSHLIAYLCYSGSGSLAAMSVFEDRYKPNMEVWKTNTYYFIQGVMCLCLVLIERGCDATCSGCNCFWDFQ